MDKELSCGLMIDLGGKFVCCHSTGKKWQPATYDIPKGHLESGEDPLETAIRECREETGIDYSDRNKTEFVDLGKFKYTSNKDLHLFYIVDDGRISDVKKLKCTSYFERFNRQWPEVDGYSTFTRDYTDLLFKSLQKVVEEAFKRLDEDESSQLETLLKSSI